MFSLVYTILRHPRERADPSAGGLLSTLPARRVGHGTRYAPGTEKGCCAGGTWRHSDIVGGRVALGSRSCILGVLQQNIFKDPFGHHNHYYYYYRGALYSKDTYIPNLRLLRLDVPM